MRPVRNELGFLDQPARQHTRPTQRHILVPDFRDQPGGASHRAAIPGASSAGNVLRNVFTQHASAWSVFPLQLVVVMGGASDRRRVCAGGQAARIPRRGVDVGGRGGSARWSARRMGWDACARGRTGGSRGLRTSSERLHDIRRGLPCHAAISIAHPNPAQLLSLVARCLWSRTVAARGGRSPAWTLAKPATEGRGPPSRSLSLLDEAVSQRRRTGNCLWFGTSGAAERVSPG